MSTISGSGSGSGSNKSNYTNELTRKNNERRVQQENDKIAQHRRELKKLAESYNEKLQLLKEQHGKEMDAMKDELSRIVDEKNRKHSQEVDDIRHLHRMQLEKTAKENGEKVSSIRYEHELQKKQMKDASQRERDYKDTRYEDILRQNNEHFENYSANIRKEMNKALEETNARNEQTRQKEVKALVEDRDRRINDSYNMNKHVTQQKNREIKTLQRRIHDQHAELTDDFLEKVKNEQFAHSKDIENRREVYKNSIEEMRQRYSDALDEERSRNIDNNDGFRSSVEKRLGEKVRDLERRINQAQQDHARTEIDLKKQYEVEKRNLRNSFQLNVDNFEQQRNEAVVEYKELSQKDLQRAKKEYDQMHKVSTDYFKKQIDDLKNKKDEISTQKEDELRQQHDHMSARMEQRVKGVRNAMQNEKNKAQNYYDDSLSQIKEVYKENLSEIHDNFTNEKNTITTNLRDSMRKSAMKSNEQLLNVRNAFDTKTQKASEETERKLRSLKWEHERLMKEQIKESKNNLEMKDIQYNSKITQMQEEHKKQVDNINKKHQDEISRLITSTTKRS